MRSKTDWLEAGLTELAASGPPGLRLEVLCEAMGATRGSFYHHFSGIRVFRRELAAHFEQTGTMRYLEEAEEAADEGPLAQIAALRQAYFDEGLTDRELLLERAFRAWGTQESFVAEVVERVDERRISYVTGLLERAEVEDAQDQASILYLILVGGLYVMPPLPADRIRQLSDSLLDRLVSL